MTARAPPPHDRTEWARARLRRPTILLLVAALHAVLLLVASRWQTRMDLRGTESLTFLALPSSVQAPAETAPPPPPPRRKPAPPQDTQLIAVPTPPAPPPTTEQPPAAIDWSAEAALAAKQQVRSEAAPRARALDQHGAGVDFNGGLPDEASRPEFGWYHARTHRVEPLEGGGSILWLNDRCFIVLAGYIPFPLCGIGKIPVRGDLFDHLHDPPAAEPNVNNTAP